MTTEDTTSQLPTGNDVANAPEVAKQQVFVSPHGKETAESRLASLPVIGGAEFSTFAAGERYKGRDDVMLARLSRGTSVVGFFTKSSTPAAPVLDCQTKLKLEALTWAELAIIVNAGNANAFTGSFGVMTVSEIEAAAVASLNVLPSRILMASTGVIGEPVNTARIVSAIEHLKAALSSDGLAAAARAIMTTDTFPKAASVEIKTEKGDFRIAGIAKGSGMIAPNMATMLAFVFTDAKVKQPLLQSIASAANRVSFDSITVDGDTSTNDTLIVAATGKANHPEIKSEDSVAEQFANGIESVMMSLAEQVVRDGEGASKFVKVHINHARTESEAQIAAFSVANSPLVKTAIAGEDPNWGRIVMAVGKSGAQIDQFLMSIWLGQHLVARYGVVAASYSESIVAEYMKQTDIDITVDLGVGDASASVMTCDLTHGYVEINADYRS